MKPKFICLAITVAILAASVDLSTAAAKETPRVSADLRQPTGPANTMFKFCVGAGRANEGLRADWRFPASARYAPMLVHFRSIKNVN